MSNSKHSRRFANIWKVLSVLSAFFVAFLSIGVAAAQDADDGWDDGWDDAVATKLATDLEETLQDAYETSLEAPPQPTALQQRQRDAAQGVIRRARNLSADYARKMRAGWSRKASEPYFRAVAEEVAHIFDTSGDAEPAISAKPLIERLHLILDQLQARYDAALLSD